MREWLLGEHGMSSFGMACWHGAPSAMAVAHQHDDLEFNASSVALDYLVDGRTVTIPPHTLAVFWAARPHQLLTEAARERVAWLTVPLADALRWALPGDLIGALIGGAVVLLPERPGLDLDARVGVWAQELAAGGESRRAASAEVEGFARRAAVDAAATSTGSPTVAAPAVGALRPDAVEMALWISRHAVDDIRVADVARQVHLAPQHAMTVFRRSLGITMGEYVVQCRVARAQQLLLTGDMPVAEVGSAAGFQSQSQFHARFRERCGESPAAYRRRLRR